MNNKTIIELNIDIDVVKAMNFFNRLQNEFENQRWDGPGAGCDTDNRADKIYGWGLQTTHDDITLPYHHFTDPSGTDYPDYKRTINCIDWANDVLDMFPYAHRACVVVSPPNTYVAPHTDNPETFRIHIPLQTHLDAIWMTDEDEVHTKTGKAYAIDVRYLHGTHNRSSVDRIHLAFAVNRKFWSDVMQLEGKI